MMNRDKNSNALFLFFILAFLLHIAVGLLCKAVPVVFLQVLLPWTPNIAAILVIIFYLREKGGVRRLASGWKKWRVSPKWYLLAFSPLVVYFLSAGIYLLFGGNSPGPDPNPFLGFSFPVMAVIAIFTGATGEELGWRGFALPQLQRRYSALVSSLILGFLWGIWHISSWIISGTQFSVESTFFLWPLRFLIR
jgi:membrane protease YdiL (CAAX protease family)